MTVLLPHHPKTDDDRTRYACPDWCIRTDHHADLVDEDNPPIHYGPEFGQVWAQGTTGDLHAFVDSYDGALEHLSPAALRTLASNALAAAEWLETVQ